jgi:homoserine O-succinyltransferase
LAAHAAVLQLDGVERRRGQQKHFGALQCTRVTNHPLTEAVPFTFPVPHSRWNGVVESELAMRGYTVLSRTSDGGVDTFVKTVGSLFVFFQGHPEYEADTLLREYRRDAARYLKAETESYPQIPSSYFDPATADALNSLREQALASRSEELLDALSVILERSSVENTWRLSAARVYRNWLDYVHARKYSANLDFGVRFGRVASQ